VISSDNDIVAMTQQPHQLPSRILHDSLWYTLGQPMYNRYHGLAILVLALLLPGCASNIPQVIREAPAEPLSVSTVRTAIKEYISQPVRWGGTIASIENAEQYTDIEIVAQRLDRFGRPVDTDNTPGRFIARVPGFLDPVIFKKGRQITVYGTIQGDVKRTIGFFPYLYPLVNVSTYYLWDPLPEPVQVDYFPIWYNPWHPYFYHSYPYW